MIAARALLVVGGSHLTAHFALCIRLHVSYCRSSRTKASTAAAAAEVAATIGNTVSRFLHDYSNNAFLTPLPLPPVSQNRLLPAFPNYCARTPMHPKLKRPRHQRVLLQGSERPTWRSLGCAKSPPVSTGPRETADLPSATGVRRTARGAAHTRFRGREKR